MSEAVLRFIRALRLAGEPSRRAMDDQAGKSVKGRNRWVRSLYLTSTAPRRCLQELYSYIPPE